MKLLEERVTIRSWTSGSFWSCRDAATSESQNGQVQIKAERANLARSTWGWESRKATILQLLLGNDKCSRNKQTDCKTLKTEEVPSILKGEWQETSENKMKLISKKRNVTLHLRFLSFSHKKNPNDFLLRFHPPSIHFSTILCVIHNVGKIKSQ